MHIYPVLYFGMPFSSASENRRKCNLTYSGRLEGQRLRDGVVGIESWQIGSTYELTSPVDGNILGLIEVVGVHDFKMVVRTIEGDNVEILAVGAGFRFVTYEFGNLHLHYLINNIDGDNISVTKYANVYLEFPGDES